MKIEIFDGALGIPAVFSKNHCVTNIVDAYDPLVILEDRLSKSIRTFLKNRGFSNHLEVKFVEHIDSARGICLAANLHLPDDGSIANFPEVTLKDEFESFLFAGSKVEDANGSAPADGDSVKRSSKCGCSVAENESEQLGFSAASFSRPENLQQALPHGFVAGECYKFDRFERSVGVIISSRRTLNISIQNARWLDALADAARVKNAVSMKVSAISDEKIFEKTRTFLSYSRFELVEEPVIKVL